MDEKPHVPGQIEAELPDPLEGADAPQPTPADPPADKAKDEPKEETPEPAKDKAEGDDPEPPKDPVKKRSIYDDYKDKKAEAKAATERAAQAETRVAELEALLETRKDADTPAEKAKAADDIDAFAKEQGLDPAALDKLIGIVQKRIPGSTLPDDIEKDLADWRAFRAQQQQVAEDQAILATAPSIKQDLGIHDDAELQAVMKEIVRLAHTKEFHDKEVDYIVWKNKETLSKLVSPKKPSFETGGQRGDGAGEGEPNFSSGKVTPGEAEKAVADRGRSAGYEIRGGAR
jgi:hypothetical protein